MSVLKPDKLFSKNFVVEYMRDGLIEEFHEGVLEFINSTQAEKFTNKCMQPYYLRSCAKPLQAALLIDYEIDFTPDEIAFCSGSHAGEECHIKTAEKILDKLGLDISYLKCGIHQPLSRTMQDRMLLKGELPNAKHNNCSGKHLGFLAVCKKQGWNLDTYYELEHPLQQKVKKKIYELCEVKSEYNLTTDGCGVPIVSMPLFNLLAGYKNLVQKYPQIVTAILENPYLYGGEYRLDTEIILNSKNILAKVGAGGLCVVYNTKINEGFAVKMNDASASARRVAVLEIVNQLNWANIHYDKFIKTIGGKQVGEIILRFQ